MTIAKRAFDSMIGRIKYYFKTNGYTKSIIVHSELGEAEVDANGKTALYGVCRQQTSQVSVLADQLHTVTGSAILDFWVDAVKDEDGNYAELGEIVRLLHECSNDITGDWYEINTIYGDHGENTSCAMLPIVSLPTVGTYQEESSNWGAGVPVSVQLFFTAVQGAMPPSGVRLIIDGVEIPTIDLVVSRSKSASTDVRAISTTGSTANSEESSTVEIQFSTPANYITTSDMIGEMLSGGTNIPHCVVVSVAHTSISNAPRWTKAYLMSFAKSQLTKTAGATVGINGNLLEIDLEVAKVPGEGGWQKRTVQASNKVGELVIGYGYTCVYWGDGTSDYIYSESGESITHTYPSEGTYNAIMYNWW